MKIEYSTTLYSFLFLAILLNMTYFGGSFLNKYLHNNIFQHLIKSNLIFFNFKQKILKIL